ncbi:MAG: hypothetical protein AAGC67_16195 [Myxococcota bacterium]
MRRSETTAGSETARTTELRRRRRSTPFLAAALGAFLLSLPLATPSLADEYDEDSAGHPLRIVAYVLHPVGVAIDYLILRPAHWLVSQEPMKTVFGHED